MEEKVGGLNEDVMSHHLCPALRGKFSFKTYSECPRSHKLLLLVLVRGTMEEFKPAE